MLKIILTKTIAKLGKRGELKNVKDGYYRNFLLPRGLAVLPTPGRLKEVEIRKAKMALEREQMLSRLSEVREKLEKSGLKFEKKITSTGKLYAAVTLKQIAEALDSQLHLSLPQEAILIPQPLKSVGKFTIELKLSEEVKVPLQVEITAA